MIVFKCLKADFILTFLEVNKGGMWFLIIYCILIYKKTMSPQKPGEDVMIKDTMKAYFCYRHMLL